ncbi:MAG: hypothetical protein CL675_00195, partial [Bdellovibrionaceae bacterium]|nr:hypothetical protein [Pseudobdellovibrionaceae bacterium]
MKQLILTTLMLVLTGPALAGREGNGAGGYEYLNANGEKEYRLLDLYEAEVPGLIHPTGVKIVGSDKDVETQVMDAIGRIKQSGWESFSTVVLTQYHMFERYATDVPMDPGQPGRKLELKFPDDAFNIFATPVGYRPVGLASWNDELNRIFIDMDKVRRLRSNTERAALRVHEAVYRALRLFDVDIEDSRLARFIVGYLFSDMSPAEYPFAYRFMAMHTGFAGYDTGWRGLPVDYIVPFRAESVLKQALFIRVRAGSEYVG